MCANSKCVPKCQSDIDCPSKSQCRGGVCVAKDGCNTDRDCPQSHLCQSQPNGRKECKSVCQIPNICGKHAGCRPVNHKAQCVCPKGKDFSNRLKYFYSQKLFSFFLGFFGSPYDEKLGCVKKLCETNSDCPGDGKCENFVCIAPQESKLNLNT